MKKFFQATLILVLVMVAMTACNDSDDYTYRAKYLPVQLIGSDKWSIMNLETGEIIARDAYATAPGAVVSDMYYVMNDKGTYDFYNVADPKKPVNSESYGSVTSFADNGLAVVSRRGKALEIINTRCEVVNTLPANISQCSMFSGDRAAYQTDDGLWGYIDERGDTVISARFISVNAFLHSDYAVTVDADQAGDSTMQFTVIDKHGNEMFKAQTHDYGIIQPFYVSGVLPVLKGDTIVCLNEKGKEVPNPNDNHQAVDKGGWNDYVRTAAGLFIVTKNGKVGLVDKDNKELIAPKWDRLVDVSPQRYIAVADSVCRIVDGNGNPVGNEKFVHVHGSIEATQAARGFINTDLVAASMLVMLGPDQCCGASPTTTLMDLNSLLGDDPNVYNGQNAIGVPQGPFRIQFSFNNYIASAPTPGAMPSFNLDAKVMAVTIGLNVAHCGLNTEQEIIDKVKAALGTRGFILDTGEIFTSEAGPAVAMGYSQGIVNLVYFMNRSYAQVLPRIARQ